MLRSSGALLALPFLESLVAPVRCFASAAKAVQPPRRMGIFTVTGGTVLESWKPSATGALTDIKLPSILRSLDFAKEDMLLLSGLSHSGQPKNVNAHQHCAYMHLTGAPSVGNENGKIFAGVSVDQVAAKGAGQHTILPSLEMGMAGGENIYSFRDANTPVPYEADPRLVFERMFRGRQPVAPNWTRRASAGAGAPPAAPPASYDRSVLDLVLGEANDLRRDLGRDDQRKLNEYLESVRSIEKRIQFQERIIQQELADAKSPGLSPLIQPALPGPDMPFHKFRDQIERDPERHGEYIRIMADLMVLAFQTDTTRVITLAVGSDGAMFPGVVTVGNEQHCHTLEHQGNAGRVEDADPIAREACRQIHAWYSSLFAEMVKKMRAIDEGGSTLLDNSMILYTSYMADGGHGTHDYPAMLVGKAGGSLKPGRHLAFQKNTPVSNLYVEMLDRMDVKVDSFGDSRTSKNAAYNGRLPDIG